MRISTNPGSTRTQGKLSGRLPDSHASLGQDNIGHDDKADYAIYIENGNFEWVKRLTEEEEKLLEEEKKKNNQRNPSITNATTLTQNFDLQERDSVVAKEVAFRLNNLTMKIPKGKLVFIIGKVGSGKSSVLYSLAGEMKQTNFNRSDRASIITPSC